MRDIVLPLIVLIGCMTAPAVAQSSPAEPPRNWHLLDNSLDHLPGASVERAYRELLAGRRPEQRIIVAIIDVGIDTTHADLRANLWVNPREIPGNGRDDDGDGFVDDVHGWNFLGGRDGRDAQHDQLEVTRLYVRCTAKATPDATPDPLAPGVPPCAQIIADYQALRGAEERRLALRGAMLDTLAGAIRVYQDAFGVDSVPAARVEALQPADPGAQRMREAFLRIRARSPALRARPKIVLADVEATRLALRQASDLTYALDPAYDPRAIIGDHYADVNEHDYGNPDVMGPNAGHGTHLAGIIGAVRGNGIGIDGVSSSVQLMMVRATSAGDERDKDVANAIRYAVDHNARIISMSFGKPYSPEKSAVDAAVRYADQHGVLLVHSAGNDGVDLDHTPSFPTPVYLDGGRAHTWIEVGASSWQEDARFAASFSNYGHERVDLFAPGVDILSTASGGGEERRSGTSQATPVVAGIAAMLMAYYPELTAAQVKEILLESATRYPGLMVVRPGASNAEHIAFAELSRTGGVVNAYAALRMAARRRAGLR